MSKDIKERFGRYFILDHLVNGGMAKICRARFLGEQADRIVAIKMVQAQFSSDPSFKQMFMDEIKVTFGLLHPNIVQTYDYGLHNEQLYVAMEYCDGRNLKEYLTRLKEKRFVFPVEISAYIISQVCQGLQYAHKFTDKLTGKAANIVHRDISPHNIMLTYDGAIKVIDFGIAKAETNSEATQAGTIKGKLSYLAPEYLEGLDLDPRYDIFSVGITLWEMLCSRKLFKAKNDLAVLKLIQECKVPAPSSINPNVPKELDEIVLKALSKDRNNRFKDMDQFNRALIKFLYANYPDFNSSDLGYFAKELFKEEIKKDREKLFEYGKIDLKPYIAQWKASNNSGVPQENDTTINTDSNSTKSSKSKESTFDFGFEEKKSTRKKPNVIKHDKKEQKQSLSIDRTSLLKRKTRRSDAFGEKDSDVEDGTGTYTKTKVIRLERKRKRNIAVTYIASFMALVALFGNYHREISKFLDLPKIVSIDEKNLNVENVEVEEEIEEKKARFTNFDANKNKVFINGKRVEPDYIKEVALPLSDTVTIRVESIGRKHFVQEVDISKLDYLTVDIPELEPTDYGKLYVSRGCDVKGTLHFELWGERRIEKVPTNNHIGISFPITGDGRVPANDDGSVNYTVYFQKFGESIQRKVNFKFSEVGQRVDLCDI